MKNKGITLISLVVTIIILLILAGISIAMLSGNNGILSKAGQARDDSIVGEEREQVELAYISAAVKKLGNDVTAGELQIELDNSVGATKTKVTGTSNYNVHFYDTDHNYSVNQGNVLRVADGEVEDISDDIFVALYNDGTLVFSNNQEDIDSSKVTENYGNIKDKLMIIDYEDYENTENNRPEWIYNEIITKVNILNTIIPVYTANWFTGLEITEIKNIQNIDTSNVTRMDNMFNDCYGLTTLDLSNFNTSNVTNMNSMFWDCGVSTIYVGDGWTTEAVTDGEDMFRCNNLIGQSGTAYDYDHMDYTYAHIDEGTSNPGYFSSK